MSLINLIFASIFGLILGLILWIAWMALISFVTGWGDSGPMWYVNIQGWIASMIVFGSIIWTVRYFKKTDITKK